MDYDILLTRLEQLFGFTDVVLAWFRSYLTQRSQLVSIEAALSEALFLLFGVPQGSVLGPLLFVLYTHPLGLIARRYGIGIHMYADDTQLYATLNMDKPHDQKISLYNLEQCIAEIRAWMTVNWLKLNDDKTDMVCLASPHFAKLTAGVCVKVGGADVACSQTVRNLGVVFDRSMKMDSHIQAVCQSAYFHLRNIRTLKPYLTPAAIITVTHAFITSRIDYCNSLLYGVSEQSIQKLQRIQNSAARVITNTPKYNHITPVLRHLRWLPVKQRVVFKILLITYKALHGLAPEYIQELITPKEVTRRLRSNDQLLLAVPKSRLRSYGDGSFKIAAPTLWNALPFKIRIATTVRQYKTLLKTHLFNCAYA